jgi:hypothetical protein
MRIEKVSTNVFRPQSPTVGSCKRFVSRSDETLADMIHGQRRQAGLGGGALAKRMFRLASACHRYADSRGRRRASPPGATPRRFPCGVPAGLDKRERLTARFRWWDSRRLPHVETPRPVTGGFWWRFMLTACHRASPTGTYEPPSLGAGGRFSLRRRDVLHDREGSRMQRRESNI